MIVEPTPELRAAREAVMEAIKPHADIVGATGLLALMSQVVGQLVALQDQTRYTPDQCTKLVADNIEMGNRQVIEGLMKSAGQA